MRIAGCTYREIQKETGIDPANLSDYFRNYLNPEIEGKRQQLFNEKDAMLRSLYRMAYASAAKFIPVLAADGTPIMHPLYDHNGVPVLNDNGEPIQTVMRDEGAMLNALASASKIAAQLIALHGLNAPNKTMMLTDASNPQTITFRIVEGKDGRMVEPEGGAAPVPADNIGSDIGATSATENIVGGVEVVTFDIDIPTTLPAPPLKYMG
jgi:hypothetical protein